MLISSLLSDVNSAYILWVQFVDSESKEGKSELRARADEVTWGSRHSSELGILETVSLRLNKALIDSTSDAYWKQKRPIIRLVKKEELQRQGIEIAFWYEIQEIAGEDFDNR